MIEFNIQRGLSSILFPNGDNVPNPKLIIEEGCWYLCTDTAELFLGVQGENGLTLKRINEVNPADIPTDVPTDGEATRIIIDAFINEETRMLHLMYSDDTEDILGPVVGKDGIDGKDGVDGKDGLTTAVQVNGVVYTHENGVITLPDFTTPDTANLATKSDLEAVQTTAGQNSVKLFQIDSDLVDIKAKLDTIPTKASELENDAGYITAADIPETDLSNYYNKGEVDAKIPSLDGYAKVEDIPTDYIKAADLESYSKFSGSYNDLIDKPTIPSIEGLATEDYVDGAIANIEHPANPTKVSELENDAGYITSADIPETNLSNYYTKTEVDTKLLDIKANDVPFTESKIVGNSLGGFVAGEDLKGLTIAKILAKLLGLPEDEPGENPDVPDVPAEPEGVVEEIIANKLPMYQLNENDELVEVDFVEPIEYKVEATDVTAALEEARLINDGQVGFYQVVSGTGEVIESGYQDITESKEPWYIIALPESLEVTRNGNVELLTWDDTATPPAWVEASYVLTSDYTEIKAAYEDADLESPVAPPGHRLWADLSESDPGTKYRFIIKDKE